MICSFCGEEYNIAHDLCPRCGSVNEKYGEKGETEVKSIDTKMYNEFNEVTPISNIARKPIGGWLILLVLGIIVSLIQFGINLMQYIKLFSSGVMDYYLDPEYIIYSPPLYYWSIYLLVFSIIIAGLLCLSLYNMVKRKKVFKKSMLIVYITNVVGSIIAYMIISSVNHSVLQSILDGLQKDWLSSIGQSVLALAVWGTYLFKSIRVDETFTE